MFKDLDYKKIYIETYGMTRSQIAKLIYEKQKRIIELEDINEEHRKLNGKLLDINNKFKDWINSLEETDMQDNFVVVRLSDIKNKLKELGGDNENNNV